MFMTYKPKGEKVRAVQVAAGTAEAIAEQFMGRVNRRMDAEPGTNMGLEGEVIESVTIPTLDGIKEIPLGMWIVRRENNTLSIMEDRAFTEQYERARVVSSRD